MKKSSYTLVLALLAAQTSSLTLAEESDTNQESSSGEETVQIQEEMLVTGGEAAIQTLSGSAHLLDEETLEQFDFSSLNQVLGQVPGVYIRSEDGYGLRPNIGLRGVSSERSQKITLMEDGVLIKPAPYSAPAAYYIPNIARMRAVEVIKGPSSIKQGPNNVGGAINLVTPSVPIGPQGFLDASLGGDGYQKFEAFYGNSNEQFGYWINALNYSSDGFKSLDNVGDTGFERNDINLKLQWTPGLLWGYEQRFIAKLGYADETSNETYLGLTGTDFRANPYRRYAASQLDRFESEHKQIHLDHLLTVSNAFKLNTKLYWNSYERAWNKLDGFIDTNFVDTAQAGLSVRDIINRDSNDLFPRELGILRGDIDSNAIPAETLDVTNNDREYGSRGIQFKADYQFATDDWEHHLEAGLRYHHDYIERDHATEGFLMTNGVMVNDGIDWGNKELNQAETDALALFVHDTISWQQWMFNAGFRYEDIKGESDDLLNTTSSHKSQSIFAPGAGVFWQYSDTLGFLFGVNKGFSPAGAAAGQDVVPEESLNYEYGLRYQGVDNRAEVIGFFSNYKNLLGRCRASDSNCSVGEEFNGGSVEVSGVEVFGEFLLPVSWGQLLYPINLTYTYTQSAFQSSFESDFSQWGIVNQGDRLPYLPEHVGRLQFGARALSWETFVALNYQSEMRDEASRGDISDVLHTDAYTTVDLSVAWIHPEWLVQASVDNLLSEEAIVSWRPFGARPNKPRTARLRVKYSF